jgi:predicted alpha/beta superfamily hydrolase
MRPFLAALALPCSLLLAAARAEGQANPPAAACRSTATGDLRLHTLTSKVFGNTRTVRVLLPAGYAAPENATRRYPVLYLLDGQNLFDACLSDVSHREWQVDETVARLVADGTIPPLIVVGVDHAGRDRDIEFLPYKDLFGNPGMRDPVGTRFPDFMGREVMPLVDSAYRTFRGRENTGIGGSSYGGIASLYALLARPNAFGYVLIESAPLWIGMGQLVRDTDPLAAVPIRVTVALGGIEAGPGTQTSALMVEFNRRLVANLAANGFDSTRVHFVVDPEGKHTEDAWAKRLPAALTFLFKDWKAPGSAGR